MEHTAADRLKLFKRQWTTGISAFLVVLCCGSVGLYLFAADFYSEYYVRQFIQRAYNAQRPQGGRLSGTPYTPLTGDRDSQRDLGRAQVHLLLHPEIHDRQTLQGMIYLANEDWRTFIDSHSSPADTASGYEALNNLGIGFLGLSEKDPTHLLRALAQFERALELNPLASEPLFNLVITYRKLRLTTAADEALQKYAQLDSLSPWYQELSGSGDARESDFRDRLRRTAQSGSLTDAEQLFDENPELARRLAMEYGLANGQESPVVVRFIGDQIERRFGDRTIASMLAPLFSDQRGKTIEVRNLVTQGAELYLQGDFRGSLEAYDKADRLVGHTDSVFDRLWIDVNRVDTQIRIGEFDSARDRLRQVISIAHQHRFAWLEAKALTIYGSSIRLITTYAEMMKTLSEADGIFVKIGAAYDRVRPLYYLAVYTNGAGDQDEALRLALECLRLTDESDAIRMSSLNYLIGSLLYRQGASANAVLFERESVEHTKRTKNAGLESAAAASLAQLYQAMSEPVLAERYVKIAEDAFSKLPNGLEQAKANIPLNTIKARIYLDQKRYTDAESILRSSIEEYLQLPIQPTNWLSQFLMLLARTYSETGQTAEAARTFNEAIQIVEDDDHYLETEKLRIKFDDERRELYDSAIDFEYDHGSPEGAWSYLQKYRAKLFLEFLAQFNPEIEQTRSDALNRSRVQRLIPKDTQVVEYALLKDRLLIWFISDKVFTSRSIPVGRAELEGTVQQTLERLRNSDDADELLMDLGNTLIAPVADLLDADRTIAIIPDRALHGLPFAALRRPKTQKYLIQEFPVMVSPSLTHLLATDAASPQRGAIVGFGSQFEDSSELKELLALRGIYRNSETFAGADVDKAKFLAAMNTAPVVHYAGHSATDAVDPLRSSILLDGNRYGPNSVTAVDISQQRLWKNAVVVLSSCDSSVGNSRDGVGMRGLTSAFLIGGAGSVVGSLWPVEASSTSELMIAFHRAFATEHMPVAKALRQAQLAFLESNPERVHPYFWSGFVVTGNFSALR